MHSRVRIYHPECTQGEDFTQLEQRSTLLDMVQNINQDRDHWNRRYTERPWPMGPG